MASVTSQTVNVALTLHAAHSGHEGLGVYPFPLSLNFPI